MVMSLYLSQQSLKRSRETVAPALLPVIVIMNLLYQEMLEQIRRKDQLIQELLVIKPKEAKIKIMEEIMIDGHIVFSDTALATSDGETTISHHTYSIHMLALSNNDVEVKLNGKHSVI